MAAYVALTSLSKTTQLLHEMIILPTTEGFHPKSSMVQHLEKEIESIYENTKVLQSFLEIPPEKTTNLFEAQIKDAADKAEGIVGRFVSGQLRSKLAADDGTLKSLCHQLQRVREDVIIPIVVKINNVVREMVFDEDSAESRDSSSRQIPLASKKVLIGVEDMFEELNRLVIKGSSTKLRLVSIVGMGGIGKTTLARKFYDHAIALELFEIHGWVTVSQDFTARDVLVSLMASIQPFVRQPKLRNESIENYVLKNLKGRRFLIVLDDVWSSEVLHFLMKIFPDDDNGSRILVTTRQKEVVVEANCKEPMHFVMMRFMNTKESYDLLLHQVFQDECCPPDLEYHLQLISYECKGLPLVIVLVAGILLAMGKSRYKWETFFKSLPRYYISGHDMVDFILYLSYKLLPHRLRSCFLYIGAFPEDYEINVSRLTKQLLAQDILHKPCEASSSSTESYEVEDCLHELVKRNLVSVLKWKSDGKIKSTCLHDMVRDFCLKKAQENGFLHLVTVDDSYQDFVGRKIKVTYHLDSLKRVWISDADDTHTIMCFGRFRIPLMPVGRFRLLKSLDAANVVIKSFPMEVLELLLLRLLALSHIPQLPPSISNLRYLETLIINLREDASPSSMSLPSILCLPVEIWTMLRLRHIISFCCGALPYPDERNPPLKNLQTLNAVMNLNCSNDMMEMIPNIKKLGIFYFGVEPATHSVKNIERLHQLEKLKLWVLVPFSSPQNLDLGYPVTLRKLTLRGIQLSHRDMKIIGQLPNLQVLKLRRNTFENDEWRITEHGFRKLRYLRLEELGLRNWVSDRDKVVFILPMLQTLVIRACKELREIITGVKYIPTLELIEVVGCKKSLVESAKRIKEEVRVNGRNPNLEVLTRNYG